METLVAACGLVCSKCEAFIGTRAEMPSLFDKRRRNGAGNTACPFRPKRCGARAA